MRKAFLESTTKQLSKDPPKTKCRFELSENVPTLFLQRFYDFMSLMLPVIIQGKVFVKKYWFIQGLLQLEISICL